MVSKKWMTYGTIGAVGLVVLGGGAAAVASTMDLRSADGTVLPGGSIDDRGGVLDRSGLQLRVTDTSVSVVTSPSTSAVASVASAPDPVSAASAVSAPSVVAPPAPAAPAPAPPAPAPAPVYDSPASPASPASPVSAVSAGSN
ncbi:hypothetical protein [Microbacterium sp. RU33B]|uniref:hypothetical protein n=1 Tax=Microbacterium sp. RU33B TaxID=1907390 RepID=UPI00095CD822|nr:hypothetical protein [Microbacterium sp. RU33B]SIT67733.1 hypothetical protein SAMN05880545_0231 [Microbacterium sp. RU33B]